MTSLTSGRCNNYILFDWTFIYLFLFLIFSVDFFHHCHFICTSRSLFLQARSDCVVQCANILEPILRVRRDLLLSNGIKEAAANRDRDVKPAICQLLLQSSRLARQESHLQVENVETITNVDTRFFISGCVVIPD